MQALPNVCKWAFPIGPLSRPRMSRRGGLRTFVEFSKLRVMPLARKIILHSPVSDEDGLAAFVEQCLVDGVSLLAIVGPGSDELEETVDWLVVADGSDPDRFLCTTSHPAAALDEAVNMVTHWELERREPYQEVWL